MSELSMIERILINIINRKHYILSQYAHYSDILYDVAPLLEHYNMVYRIYYDYDIIGPLRNIL